MTTTRRDFLKYGGLGLGALAASGLLPWPFRRLTVAEAAELANYGEGTWIASCCNMCGGQDGVLAFVEGGVVRKIEPNGANPNNVANISASFEAARAAGDNGRLCCKGNSAVRSLYDPDRLRTPLKRVGPRGSGQYVAISWDEAVAEVARRLSEIKTNYGARSILWFCEDHSFNHAQQDLMDALGAPNFSNHSNLCDTGRKAHYKSTIGHDRPLPDMEGTDFLLVFGWNFLSAIKWIHLAAIFTRARQRNPHFKFVYVDPVFNTTASKADQWIAPRPGSDGALALALAKELLDYDAGTGTKYDKAFVDTWTTGLTSFRKYLDGDGTFDGEAKNAVWGEKQTGVPAAAIANLARDLGDACAAGRKICIDTWSGPGHRTNATQGGRAINCLNLLLGAVDRPGSMVLPLRDGPGRLPASPSWPGKDGWRLDGRDDVKIPSTEPAPVVSNRSLVASDGAVLPAGADLRGRTFHKKYAFSHGSGIYIESRDSMIRQRDFLGVQYPMKAAVFVFQNFLMSVPNTQKNIDAINQMEFVLSVDTHLSETAMMADIVVPGTHYLERFDFNPNWITFRSMGLRQPVIPSWVGGRSETQFFFDVGAALGLPGFDAANNRDLEARMFEAEWSSFSAKWESRLTWEQLKQTGVWIESGAKGGTHFEKHRSLFSLSYNSKWMHVEGSAAPYRIMSGAATGGGVLLGTTTSASPKDGDAFSVDAAYSAGGYQGDFMHVEVVTFGGDTRHLVKSGTEVGSGEVLGVAPGATPANGESFPVGFSTETRLAQFWSKSLDDYWKAGSSKYPAGASVAGDARYHPLPFFLPPEDGPDAVFPLSFISWKEVEHTHTRTFNNEWLMEMKPENKLLIHPTRAAALLLQENDLVAVETAQGQVRARIHVTQGIQVETVGLMHGFGHWALGKLAKGKGAHDGWLLPGKAEVHSGQAVTKEVACRIFKVQ